MHLEKHGGMQGTHISTVFSGISKLKTRPRREFLDYLAGRIYLAVCTLLIPSLYFALLPLACGRLSIAWSHCFYDGVVLDYSSLFSVVSIMCVCYYIDLCM